MAESRLKQVPEGAEEAAEPAAQEAAAGAVDGQQAAGAQDFPEATQRGPSRQPSRKSLDWKRQESMLIGTVSAPCLLDLPACLIFPVHIIRMRGFPSELHSRYSNLWHLSCSQERTLLQHMRCCSLAA